MEGVERARGERASLDFSSMNDLDFTKDGRDLDFTGSGAMEIFHRAVKTGDVETACQAMGEGADPNKAGPDGTPPISVAAGRGHAAMVQLLIDAWTDLEQVDSHGMPPLRHSTRPDNPSTGDFASTCLRIMLEGGADPDSRGRDGKTAIHAAFEAGAIEAVDTLAAGGADANLPPTGRTRSPLWSAIAMENEDMVEAMLGPRTNLERQVQNGRTLLHGAAENGMGRICKLLLDAGADPKAKGDDGKTPIELGLASGDSRTTALFEALALSEQASGRSAGAAGTPRRI